MKNFYSNKIQKIFEELKTDPEEGLSQKEAEKRLKKDGLNELPRQRQKTVWGMIFDQIKSPLVYILFVAAALSFYLGEMVDGTVILAAAFVSIAIGFWQEYKSENIFEKLSSAIERKALVIRSGRQKEIAAKNLVKGDIIVLEEGRDIPADARLFEVSELKTIEAALTGESHPVTKKTKPLKEETSLANRENMVFMGTSVNQGSGKAVVTATSQESEIGNIADLVQTTEKKITPLQKKMKSLARFLALFVVLAGIVIAAVGLYQSREVSEILITAVAVSVAAVPEGLVPAISVILAVSSNRIYKVGGLVRRLVAAETLGSASIICTDKTGTLTEGKMEVDRLITLEGDLVFGPEGIDKEKSTLEESERFVKPFLFANEALVENPEDDFKELNFIGRPTDTSILKAGIKLGGDKKSAVNKGSQITKIPFNSKWKYLASIHPDKAYMAGAPESILKFSNLSKDKKKKLKKKNEELASKGFRVVAFGQKEMELSQEEIESKSRDDLKKEVERDLEFLCLVVIRDPIRPDVKESIDTTRKAGIKPIIVTGDHLLTAKAVGEELGFDTKDRSVIEGEELNNLSEEEFEERIDDIEIYARVTPENKMRIVETFQKRGEAIAMTGDGINDAPALKKSDIGISVESGTDVTREASDLVLLDNSFSVIKEAIKQGRTAFDNMRKTILFLLTTSFVEIGIITSFLVSGLPIPITGVQVLWINFIEDVLPGISLSFEKSEDKIMERDPTPQSASLVDSMAKNTTFIITVIMTLAALIVYWFSANQFGWDTETLRTVILTTIGLKSLIYIWPIKTLNKPIWKTDLSDNKFLIFAVFVGALLLFGAVYLPFLNNILETTPLGLYQWIPAIITALIVGATIEVMKFFNIEKTN